MVEHGGSSASSYLADPTSPIPSHCAPIVATSTLRGNIVACAIDREEVTRYVMAGTWGGNNGGTQQAWVCGNANRWCVVVYSYCVATFWTPFHLNS